MRQKGALVTGLQQAVYAGEKLRKASATIRVKRLKPPAHARVRRDSNRTIIAPCSIGGPIHA